jgi:hypothetical protein
MYEDKIIKDLNESQIIDIQHNKKSVPYQIVGTQLANKNCNFDAKIMVNGNSVGILEIKTFHMKYDNKFFNYFTLQLCKLHFPKLDVPFLLIVECKCGTLMMYQYKPSHLKKFTIGQAQGYKHYYPDGRIEDSDELFFFVPKTDFKLIGQKKRPTFKLKSLEHLPMIDKGVNAKINRILDTKSI